MNYWETIELIGRDWGMGHVLTDPFDREAIVQLIDEIGSTLVEEDQHWLQLWGLQLHDDGEGLLEFSKGGRNFVICPAPRARLFAGGKLLKPEVTFFNYKFYGQLKHRVTMWARDI